MPSMTTKEIIENEREKWKGIAKGLDRLFELSATPGNRAQIKDGVVALSAEIRAYLPLLRGRVYAELGDVVL